MRRRAALLLAALWLWVLPGCASPPPEPETAATFAMDTLIEQTVWGGNAQTALREVNAAFSEMERRLSLFEAGSEVARINAGAGRAGGARVSPQTAKLLETALAVSRERGGFAATIAPLTLAWGVTGENPRVPPKAEIDALLPLVDDAAVQIEGDTVLLSKAGMGIDLGAVAKGAACDEAARIYAENGVESGWLWAGGSIYARGTKPGGERFRFGFADPQRQGSAYIASFEMEDAFIAVSGGYERYFEENGQRYIHIIDPQTGYPAESDIASVGVVSESGTLSDCLSTALFVEGLDAALDYMEGGGVAIVLDEDGTLWVSEALREGFKMQAEEYELKFVASI